jgi:hypothetical protein
VQKVPSCEPHRFSPAFLGDVLAGLLDSPFRRASREVADLGLTRMSPTATSSMKPASSSLSASTTASVSAFLSSTFPCQCPRRRVPSGSRRIDVGRRVVANRCSCRVRRPAVRTDLAGALAEFAQAADYDLATPDHSAAAERAYAHDCVDFGAFFERHGLGPGRSSDPRALPQKRSKPDAAALSRRRWCTVGLALPTLPGAVSSPVRQQESRRLSVWLLR